MIANQSNFINDSFNKVIEQVSAIIEKIAKRLKSVEDLIVARVDVILNEIEGISLAVLPAIRFFPRDNKQNPLLFTDDKKEDNIIQWVQKHSTYIN